MAPAREELRARVEALPGMDVLLPALEGLEPAYLVGGAVRDLLLGAGSVDLDVAVEGDAVALARELARRIGGEAAAHDRFGTARVRSPELTVDLARTRRETYERPGALPAVEAAELAEDLRRRDFTINAMAIALSGPDTGKLSDPYRGAEDLDAGFVRVLHDRSFEDDPTRLLRAARMCARLGFRLVPETLRQARSALAAGALETLSGPRLRNELMLLLAEQEAPSAVAIMRDLGVVEALGPALAADPERVAGAILGSAETGADPQLAALAAMLADTEDAERFVERLSLTAPQHAAVLAAGRSGPQLAQELTRPLRDSELHALLAPQPPEALAVALAHRAPAEPVLRFVGELRPARLEIGGDDLLAAGIPESPAIGRALAETLRRKLDGELTGREAELRTAIELARETA